MSTTTVASAITQFGFNVPIGNTREYTIALTLTDLTILKPSACSEIWFTVKQNKNDTDPGVIRKTLSGGNGITVINDTAGTVLLTLLPSDTLNLGLTVDKDYYADVKVRVTAGNKEYTILEGIITMHVVLTRAV